MRYILKKEKNKMEYLSYILKKIKRIYEFYDSISH